MVTGLPLDDLRELLNRLPPADEAAARAARERAAALAESGFATGRAGRFAEWAAAWSGQYPPRLGRCVVALFVGTHAVAGQGGSAYAPGFEQRFVEHAAAGGAPVNQLCGANDLGLKIFDLALDIPVADITAEPAMDERGCAATIAFGMEAIAGGADLLCLGGIGAGGEIASAALMTALAGGEPRDWLGDHAAEQASAVEQALATHAAALRDPLEALRRLGGREMAALAGAIVAARTQKVPVVLDGWAALAAAAVLHAASPGAAAHCVAADVADAGQARAVRHLGLATVLDLGLGCGDGTAGAMAVPLIRDAALLLERSVPLPAV